MSDILFKYCPDCGTATQQQERDGRLRAVCDTCERIHYLNPKVAGIAFIKQDNRLLLIQRGVSPHKGRWALPGGYVEYDEHPEDGVKREVFEETGLIVDVGAVLGVFHGRGTDNVITIAYQCTHTEGVLKAGDDVTNARWFNLSDAPDVVFTSSIILVKKWKQGEI